MNEACTDAVPDAVPDAVSDGMDDGIDDDGIDDGIDAIARTVLYEGYALFPYRASSLKNRRRLTFGALAAAGGAERSQTRTEVLVTGVAGGTPRLSACCRFLHSCTADEQGWQEAVEREVRIELVEKDVVVAFCFGDARTPRVAGRLSVSVAPLGVSSWRVAVVVDNDASSLSALESLHTVLRVDGGRFATPREHDDAEAALVALLSSDGCWPVLVGKKGSRSAVLCSPIILEDWPSVARESPGDAYDATENDALLSLSIRALSDDERRQMAALDPRTKALLDRSLALQAADLAALHGAWRDPPAASSTQNAADTRDKKGTQDTSATTKTSTAATPIRAGDAVILRPKVRTASPNKSDIFDIALAGQAATVVSVDVDVDDRVFVSVTVDCDPGRDLGLQGHRFFFALDEVERAPAPQDVGQNDGPA